MMKKILPYLLTILLLSFSVFAISSGSIVAPSGSTTNNYYNITNVTGGNITGNISAGYVPLSANGSFINNSIISQSTGSIAITSGYPNITLSSSVNTVPFGLRWTNGGSFDASITQLPQTGELRADVGRTTGWGGHITFYTDTLERMRITSLGMVGIGTNGPGARLEVNNGGEGLRLRANTTNLAQFQTWYNSAGTRLGYFGFGSGGSANLDLVNERASGHIIVTPGSSGNVGIGTASPLTLVHINTTQNTGAFKVTNNTNHNALFINTSNLTASFGRIELPAFVSIIDYQAPTNYDSSITGRTGLFVKAQQGGNVTISSQTVGGSGGTIELYGGDGGFATNASTTIGGTGGTLLLRAGDGGTPTFNTASQNRGGQGGALALYAGHGGNSSGVAPTRYGGLGGTVFISGGNGGYALNGSAPGRQGGGMTLSTGAGGQTIYPSTGSGGAGGAMQFTAGNGGYSQNNTGGAGGSSTFTGGMGGNTAGNSRTAGAGGDFTFLGGTGGIGTGGTSQTGGRGGHIYFGSGAGGTGTGASGLSGNIYVYGQGTIPGNMYIGYSGSVVTAINVSIGNSNSPASKVHQDSGTATATYHKFTAGTTTGQATTDGLDIGISATGEAQIKQLENHNLTLYTNNIERIKINMTGDVIIKNLTGTGNDYVCVSATGGLYRADIGCV